MEGTVHEILGSEDTVSYIGHRIKVIMIGWNLAKLVLKFLNITHTSLPPEKYSIKNNDSSVMKCSWVFFI